MSARTAISDVSSPFQFRRCWIPNKTDEISLPRSTPCTGAEATSHCSLDRVLPPAHGKPRLAGLGEDKPCSGIGDAKRMSRLAVIVFGDNSKLLFIEGIVAAEQYIQNHSISHIAKSS
jgi:hypothetical protein